jgi:hypothetical protein
MQSMKGTIEKIGITTEPISTILEFIAFKHKNSRNAQTQLVDSCFKKMTSHMQIECAVYNLVLSS